MIQIKDIAKYRKEMLLVGITVLMIVLAEALVFNRDYIFRRFSGLEERRYSIQDGIIFQFEILKGGRLAARSNDPNITFTDINTRVESVFIRCDNSKSEAFGQIFYRFDDEPFSEEKSIIYDPKMKGALIKLPLSQMVSSLRIDLTNLEGDIVICKEFIVNPFVAFDQNITRLATYLFLLLGVFLLSRVNMVALKNDLQSIRKAKIDPVDVQLDKLFLKLSLYLKENGNLILVLCAVALAAYGFELFNLNLTIDEEYYSFINEAPLAWVAQGRWGMYFLNKFLLPYTVVPFVPLGLALMFHIAATLIILKSWKLDSKIQQIAVGAIILTFPSSAFMYMFSTLNFGVGIGFLCVALSQYIYLRNIDRGRFLAIIPAIFAVSIYQGFILALILIFLIALLSERTDTVRKVIDNLFVMAWINAVAVLVYYIAHRFFLALYSIPLSNYIIQRFNIPSLQHNFNIIASSFRSMLYRSYLGDMSIYGINVKALGVLLVLVWLGTLKNIFISKLPIGVKFFSSLFIVATFLLPFSSGFLMNGNYDMRFLLGLPLVVAGWTMLSMRDSSRYYRILVICTAFFGVFQFIVSTNHLFASSALALQADRLLASRLIEHIEDAKAESSTTVDVKYMEVIGYLPLPQTSLIPKVSTFGASFFEWDQGNTSRVVAFMKTIGYQDLLTLPSDRRIQFNMIANSMPEWPANGSVMVINDTVLVKFGPYSALQKQIICNTTPKEILQEYSYFCRQ